MKNKILVASFESLTATSAGGIGHLGYKVAKELHQRERLKKFVVSAKGKFETPFSSSPVSFTSRYYLFLLHRLEKLFNIQIYKSRYLQEVLYDHFCSFHLDKTVTTLVTTTPYLFQTFQKARKLGITIYFIPGNPEDNYIAQLVHEENAKYNIQEDDAYTYLNRLNYYNKSLPLTNYIITYSALMEESYRKKGYGDKLISTRGYLKPDFSKHKTTSGQQSVFKVSFLAFTVLLKGLQYLLEAWKDLQHLNIELHVGGPIDKNVQNLIDEQYSDLKNVFYHGRVTDIPSFFENKSLYVLPSIIDGAPVTILEAMHCSVPVIVSDNCGTKDIVAEGKSGWVVPNRNAVAIKEKILEAYHDPQRTAEMGRNGKEILDNYNMQDFVTTLADIVCHNKSA
ncbi:MAG TPA: glycosyltransferase [Flavipsychrobacter sp.]|nr:glycosyltransferase [Flavipsychrobacter sp.]